MTWGSIVEVTCNLWALYNMERVARVNRVDRLGPNRRAEVQSYWASGDNVFNWDAAIGLKHYASLLEGVGRGDVNAGWVGATGVDWRRSALHVVNGKTLDLAACMALQAPTLRMSALAAPFAPAELHEEADGHVPEHYRDVQQRQRQGAALDH